MARAALAALQVELQVAVAAGDRLHGGQRLVGEGGAAQVGVDDDAGGVDDGPQGGCYYGADALDEGRDNRVVGRAGPAGGDGAPGARRGARGPRR